MIENALSWIVVLAMLIYGGAKWMQFEGAADIDKVVSELTGMELMWAFYGYSRAFILTLGVLEITGGILMLIKRTRIIGCLFLSTILVNIILQDIFYGINQGALKAAIIYQSCILIILWMNRIKLIRVFNILIERSPKIENKKKFFAKMLIAFIIFVVLRVAEFYATH